MWYCNPFTCYFVPCYVRFFQQVLKHFWFTEVTNVVNYWSTAIANVRIGTRVHRLHKCTSSLPYFIRKHCYELLVCYYEDTFIKTGRISLENWHRNLGSSVIIFSFASMIWVSSTPLAAEGINWFASFRASLTWYNHH